MTSRREILSRLNYGRFHFRSLMEALCSDPHIHVLDRYHIDLHEVDEFYTLVHQHNFEELSEEFITRFDALISTDDEGNGWRSSIRDPSRNWALLMSHSAVYLGGQKIRVKSPSFIYSLCKLDADGFTIFNRVDRETIFFEYLEPHEQIAVRHARSFP